MNKHNMIWNADESGFPLCPSTGRVIAMKNSTTVYGVTGDSKEQVTILCAVSASGNAIPPMAIFPGERFTCIIVYKVHGCSQNGWMNTELFYGWLANHFSKIVTIRPVVLLVDGHSSHINLEVSKFCRDNSIFLYCFPAHASHILQPLDVSFFKSLKSSWGKACDNYRTRYPGSNVTKHTFFERPGWLQFKCQPLQMDFQRVLFVHLTLKLFQPLNWLLHYPILP